METLLQDVRYSFRSLRKRMLFTSIAVLTLAIGIGANTAIFSVVNSALLRPLPFPEPERLVRVSLIAGARPNRRVDSDPDRVWSYPKWEILRREQRSFSELAAYTSMSYTLSGTGEPERLTGELASAEYFDMLGVTPIAGRVFTEEEATDPAKASIAAIGEALWQRRFNSDRNIIGQTIRLDGVGTPGQPVTVVGVIPSTFRGLSGNSEVWTPLANIGRENMQERWSHFMTVIARLAPAVSLERAQQDIAVLGKRIDAEIPDAMASGQWGARVRSLDELRVDPAIRKSVLVLFGAVATVLLIACANVANLLLARASDRRREIAVRLAIGAARMRLVRQLITEAVVLALLGGGFGILLGALGVRGLAALASNAAGFVGRSSNYTTVTLSAIGLDATVLTFTLIATVVTGLLFGLLPAFQATRPNLTNDLRQGGAATLGGYGMRSVNGRNALVVAEIALAFVLLIGSGLMVRSLGRLLATDAGFDPRNLLTLRITLPGTYEQPQVDAFWNNLLERLRTAPGVVNAAATDCPPLSGGCNGTIMWYRDRPPVPEGTEPSIGVHWVTPEYFATVRNPLRQGRLFDSRDRRGSPKVVLINEAAAQKFFAGENPIGRRIGVGQGGFADGAEIIGIVGNQRYVGVETPAEPDVYIPYAQSVRPRATIFLRTTVAPSALITTVRKEVQRLDPNLPIFDVMTMDERVGVATARTRVTGLLLGLFAATALVLAIVGIYGVIAFAVAQRSREFGLRIALGAVKTDIARLILQYGGAVVGLGITIGLLGAWAATRVLRSMLFEIEPTDPFTFVTLTLVTIAVAFAATAAPAIRATRVDPMITLKSE